MPEKKDVRMSFIRHLEELRKRLVRTFIAVGVGFLLCYRFSERIFDFLARPLVKALPEGSHMAMIGVTEGFVTYFKLALYAGLFITSPFVLYQAWAFVSPALYRKEKKLFRGLILASSLLFLLGVAFGYFVFLPAALAFFTTFVRGYIVANFSIAWYSSFALLSLLAFGVVFQLPLVLMLLNYMGVVHAPFLKRFRKYALLLAFIVGAILTPTPDAMNQILMSVPIYLFYELSIWLIVIFGKKPKVEEEGKAAPAAGAHPTAPPDKSPAG